MEKIIQKIEFKIPKTSKECYNIDCCDCIYIHKKECPIWNE